MTNTTRIPARPPRGATAAALPPLLLVCACVGGGGDDAASAAAGGVDLATLDVQFDPPALEAGEVLSATVRIANRGGEPAGTFRVGLYLSHDSIWSSDDALVTAWTVGALGAGFEATVGQPAAVPLGTPVGEYHVLAVADDLGDLGEPSVGDNALAAASRVRVDPPTRADLVPTSVAFAPASVEQGGTIDVDDVVANVGVVASGSFRVGVRLSPDPVIDPGDTVLGHRTVIDLAAGEDSSASGTLTVPAATPPGTYYVGVLADDLDQVDELDETDNGAAATTALVVLPAPHPDLVPDAVTFAPASVQPGEAIQVDETIRNAGGVDATVFQAGVFLSLDATIDPAEDELLGHRTVPGLAAGATSSSGLSSLTVPAGTPSGSWYVGVLADHTSLVPESEEGNNGLVAVARLWVDAPDLPDLVAESIAFTPPVVPTTGGVVSITEAVRNDGAAASATMRVAVYLSPNATISAGDVRLGWRDVPPLAPGARSESTADYALPAGTPAGSYYLGLLADELGEVDEVSEGNNLLLADDLLDVSDDPGARADLVTELVDPAANQVAPGATISVTTRVVNDGDVSSGAFDVGVFLSTDAVVDASDVLLGERVVPFGLGVGFASVAAAPVTVPAGTPDGDYTLGAIADWRDSVDESDEANNTLVAGATFRVQAPRPNLQALSVDAAVTGPLDPGEAFSVDLELRNAGGLDAGAFRVAVVWSDDTTIDAADLVLGTDSFTGLAVGARETRTLPVAVPATAAAGSYTVGLVVDDLDAVLETDEDDNTASDGDTVDVQ